MLTRVLLAVANLVTRQSKVTPWKALVRSYAIYRRESLTSKKADMK